MFFTVLLYLKYFTTIKINIESFTFKIASLKIKKQKVSRIDFLHILCMIFTVFCRVDPDPSVRFMCQVPGTNGSKICEHYVAPGTIVKPVCNTPNYYSSESLRYMKCIGGSWDYIARCNAGLPKNRTNIAIQINDKLEIDIGDFFNDNSNKITVNLGSSSATNNNNNVYNLTNNNILNIYINNDRYVNGITSATVNLMDLFHASGSNKNKNEISLTVGSSAANNNNNNKYNLTNNNVLNIHINNYRHGNEVATSTVNPIKFVNGNGSNKNNNEVSVNVGSSGANNNNYKKYNLAHDNFLNIYINNKGYSVEKLSTRTDYQ